MGEPTKKQCKKHIREPPDNFLSVYMYDFKQKSGKRDDLVSYEPDYKDILSGPYENYLLPATESNALKDNSNCEEISIYRKKLVDSKPEYKQFLEPSVDENVIKNEILKDRLTVYQTDYCKIDASCLPRRMLEQDPIALPENWGPIPLTTQRGTFRDLTKIFGENVRPEKFQPPASSLDPDQTEREILQVATGESEYEHLIGALGKEIVEFSYHGDVPNLPREISTHIKSTINKEETK